MSADAENADEHEVLALGTIRDILEQPSHQWHERVVRALGLGVPYHVIDVDGEKWAIQHPISCRIGGRQLLDCPVHEWVESDFAHDSPPVGPGRYRISFDEEYPIYEDLKEPSD